MSILLDMADMGLPAGLPGVSDATKGHPFTHPSKESGVSFSNPAMGGVPSVKSGPGGMPDILASAGMRGKSG